MKVFVGDFTLQQKQAKTILFFLLTEAFFFVLFYLSNNMKTHLVFPILCIPFHEPGRSGHSWVFGSGCKDSPDHPCLGLECLSAGILAELLLPYECLGQGQTKNFTH